MLVAPQDMRGSCLRRHLIAQAACEGDRERTIRALNESGLEATDLGDNELAKARAL